MNISEFLKILFRKIKRMPFIANIGSRVNHESASEEIKTNLEKVSHCWNDTAARREICPYVGWLDSPIVLEEYVQIRQTGDPRKNWLVGLLDNLKLPRDGHWLSLGCGPAGTELYGSQMRLFASMRAFDISDQSIAIARKSAAKQKITNIEFSIMDLNNPSLPRAEFDVAMMCMSLHHVANLKGTLQMIHDSLKPGGHLLLNEYVGPRQFQFTDLQLSISRELLAVLPEALRMDRSTNKPKTEYLRQPIDHWNKVDPSEAIRSDEILSTVAATFEIVYRADYGGTLLSLILENIIHNFRPDRAEDVALIRLLGATEHLLIHHGVLSSDFTVLAARKRDLGVTGSEKETR